MKIVSLVLGSALAVGIVAAPAPAQAQAQAQRFGARGALAISSDVGLSVQHQFVNPEEQRSAVTTLSLHPAADYFLIDHLSIGGYAGFTYTGVLDASAFNIGLGPRIGYDFNLGSHFSFWPKAGAAFNHTTVSLGWSSGSNNAVTLNLFAPFLFHPVDHFFLGFGPNFDVDVTGMGKRAILGGRLVIGGHFGL